MGRSRSRWQDKFLKLPNIGIGFNYQSMIWKKKKNEEWEPQYRHNWQIIISTKTTRAYGFSLFWLHFKKYRRKVLCTGNLEELLWHLAIGEWDEGATWAFGFLWRDQIPICILRERERDRTVDTIRRYDSRTDLATSWHLFAFSLSRCELPGKSCKLESSQLVRHKVNPYENENRNAVFYGFFNGKINYF